MFHPLHDLAGSNSASIVSASKTRESTVRRDRCSTGGDRGWDLMARRSNDIPETVVHVLTVATSAEVIEQKVWEKLRDGDVYEDWEDSPAVLRSKARELRSKLIAERKASSLAGSRRTPSSNRITVCRTGSPTSKPDTSFFTSTASALSTRIGTCPRPERSRELARSCAAFRSRRVLARTRNPATCIAHAGST
jgi:hypothetical protein